MNDSELFKNLHAYLLLQTKNFFLWNKHLFTYCENDYSIEQVWDICSHAQCYIFVFLYVFLYETFIMLIHSINVFIVMI